MEPFDDEQIARWTGAWNAANRGLRPLDADELAGHRTLAGQPLLLLMLAVHAAGSGARLDASDLEADELYRRLLDSFIRRQVREKAPRPPGDAESARLEAAARHDLSAAAFAMFNRGRQYVSEQDLDGDLDALRPAGRRPDPPAGEPVTRAKRTVAGFFFVHVAQADDDTRAPGRRTYEFLHATFAEYLVAEHTVELLDELAEDRRRSARRAYGTGPDDTALRTLLSHQPLTNGQQIIPFLAALLDRRPPGARADLLEALLDLFRVARSRVDDGAYRPTPFDAVNRLAAYTANLVLLAALCDPDGLPVTALDGPSLDSTVRLWRCGLDPETQSALFARLHRTDDHFTVQYGRKTMLPMSEAVLTGDVFTEAVLDAGRTVWMLDEVHSEALELTRAQGVLHNSLLSLFIDRWPTPRLGRMMPFDEEQYARWADAAGRPGASPHPATLRLLLLLLLRDGDELDPALFERLAGLLSDPQIIRGAQPLPALLAAQVGNLWRRRPDLAAPDNLSHLLLTYQVALRTELADRLRQQIMQRVGVSHGIAAVPSMVTGLAAFPAIMPQVLADLTTYHHLAWSQVRPRDLLPAVAGLDPRKPEIRGALADYVECRRGEAFDPRDAEAFAKLRALAGGGANEGCC